MRHLRWPLVLVLVVTACGGGSTTSPTSTATNPGLPLVWAGSAWFSDRRVSQSEPLSGLGTRFEGTVTWQKHENLALPSLLGVPVGSLRYAISASQMRVTFHSFGTRCTHDGEVQVALQPFQEEYPEPGDDPALWASYLIVGQDGEYRGEVHSQAIVPVTLVCTDQESGRLIYSQYTQRTVVHLYIRGSLINGGRMQGEMPPDHFADTTLTGGWDFQGR